MTEEKNKPKEKVEKKVVEVEKKEEEKIEKQKTKNSEKKEVKSEEKKSEEKKSESTLETKIKKEVEKIVEETVSKAKPISKRLDEREYIIPLRKRWKHVPRYKRASKAIKAIKEFLVRHMKVRDGDLKKIKIDKFLNETVWTRGIKKPPSKIKVKAFRDGEDVIVEVSEMSEKLKFKKARLEKREDVAQDLVQKKKSLTESLKEKVLEDKVKEKIEIPEAVREAEEKKKEEKKKEEQEKKAAVVEAGEKQSKAAAKRAKHQTKISKGPKRPQRKALAK